MSYRPPNTVPVLYTNRRGAQRYGVALVGTAAIAAATAWYHRNAAAAAAAQQPRHMQAADRFHDDVITWGCDRRRISGLA